MIETSQQERENLKRITLEVNKIAFTLLGVDTAKSQQHLLLTRAGKEFDDVSKANSSTSVFLASPRAQVL